MGKMINLQLFLQYLSNIIPLVMILTTKQTWECFLLDLIPLISYFTLCGYTTMKKNHPIVLHSKEIRCIYSLKKLKNRLKMLMIIECELMPGPSVN